MIRRPDPRRSGFSRAILLVGVGAVALGVGVVASAQQSKSPAQLRRENDALRERITELEAEIAQADKRIRSLDEQLAKASAQLDQQAANNHDPETEAPPNAPGRIPDDRFGCPAALRNWLIEDYSAQFKNNPSPSRKQLEQWQRRVALERATVVWDLRMLGWSGDNTDTARVRCFDRATGEDLCFPFLLPLPENDADKLRNNPAQSDWTIEGILAATTGITEVKLSDANDQQGKGPPQTGLSLEFGWTLSIRSLEPFNPDDPGRGVAR